MGAHSHRRSIIRSAHRMMVQTTAQTGNRRPEASAQLRLRWRANRVAGDAGPNCPENYLVNVWSLQRCKIKNIPNVCGMCATFCLCLWTCILQWAHQQDSSHSALTAQRSGVSLTRPPIINTLHCLLGQCCSQCPRPKHWLGSGFGPWAPHGRCTLLLRDGLNENKLHSDCMWQTFSYIWVHVHQMRWKSFSRECGTEITSLFIILPEEHTSDHGRRDQRRRKATTKSISDFQKMYWMLYGCCPCSVSGSDLIWLETHSDMSL